MAGMNRLGSGPKRPPAVPRPVDPNRFKSIELKPEDTEGDLEYQKLVKEVEEGVGSRQAGWLFGRGAFDRTDLQYLKDEDDKKKYIELERAEQEKSVFAQLRAKQEAAGEEAAGDAVHAAAEKRREAKKQIITSTKHASVLARVVKVKRTGAGCERDPKRPKGDGDAPGEGRKDEHADLDGSNPKSPVGLPGLLGDYGSDSD